MKKKNKLEQSLASCLCLCLSTSLKPKFQPNSSENYFNLINLLREVPQTGGGQQNSFLFFSWEFFDEWLFPAKYSEHTWLCKSVRPQDLPPRSYCVKRVAESPSDEDWYFGLLKVCWFEILCSDGKSVTFTCFHVSYSIQLHFLSVVTFCSCIWIIEPCIRNTLQNITFSQVLEIEDAIYSLLLYLLFFFLCILGAFSHSGL